VHFLTGMYPPHTLILTTVPRMAKQPGLATLHFAAIGQMRQASFHKAQTTS
jgi:hypothetical protein